MEDLDVSFQNTVGLLVYLEALLGTNGSHSFARCEFLSLISVAGVFKGSNFTFYIFVGGIGDDFGDGGLPI